MTRGCEALTERERQTLRLILDGHDAKSMARQLGISVHTVNDRLRESRRKLSVSTSKEAARLLRQSESAAPQKLAPEPLGDALPDATHQQADQPGKRPLRKAHVPWVIGGCAMIFIVVASAALLSSAEPQAAGAGSSDAAVQQAVVEAPVTRAARDWLALVDAGKWAESWAGTGQSFRSLNSVATWQSASEKARVPLGRVVSRTLVSEQDTPAPPHGYRTARFHTDFANKPGATETLSLDREGDSWKVVGIYIE